MSTFPTDAERQAALDEYQARTRIVTVPRIVGTDEHGYAALMYYWEKNFCAINREQRAMLKRRGYDDARVWEFASFDARADNSDERIRECCAIADLLMSMEPDHGIDFELFRGTAMFGESAKC